jgi:DNA polymerase V
MPRATSLTHEIIAYAMPLVDELFRDGQKYLKAGVTLTMIVPDSEVQQNLFTPQQSVKGKALMEAVDNLNFSMRGDVVKYVSSGLTRNWKMRQEMRSQRFTTRWEELFEIK